MKEMFSTKKRNSLGICGVHISAYLARGMPAASSYTALLCTRLQSTAAAKYFWSCTRSLSPDEEDDDTSHFLNELFQGGENPLQERRKANNMKLHEWKQIFKCCHVLHFNANEIVNLYTSVIRRSNGHCLQVTDILFTFEKKIFTQGEGFLWLVFISFPVIKKRTTPLSPPTAKEKKKSRETLSVQRSEFRCKLRNGLKWYTTTTISSSGCRRGPLHICSTNLVWFLSFSAKKGMK